MLTEGSGASPTANDLVIVKYRGTFLDGTDLLQKVPLDAKGKAVFTTAALAVGRAHSITASYSGDGSFTDSAGGVLQPVSRAATTTALAVTPGTSVFGQTVFFTATVSVVAPATGHGARRQRVHRSSWIA